jgi:hypothetical protein
MGVISDEIEDDADQADAPKPDPSGSHPQIDPFLATYDMSDWNLDWEIVDRAVTLAAAVSLIKTQ